MDRWYLLREQFHYFMVLKAQLVLRKKGGLSLLVSVVLSEVAVSLVVIELSTVAELSLSPGLENRTSSIGYPRSMLFAKEDA